MKVGRITDQQFSEALKDSALASNEWLKKEYPEMALAVQLESRETIKKTFQALRDADGRRVSHWDWVDLYHSKVRNKTHEGWMISLKLADACAGASYGRVDVKKDCVCVEYIERNTDIAETKGLMTIVAFQFAVVLAAVLSIDEVRINNPFPEVVSHYEKVLHVSRHEEAGEVKYLFKKVSL